VLAVLFTVTYPATGVFGDGLMITFWVLLLPLPSPSKGHFLQLVKEKIVTATKVATREKKFFFIAEGLSFKI
jgi:hypothetical protein